MPVMPRCLFGSGCFHGSYKLQRSSALMYSHISSSCLRLSQTSPFLQLPHPRFYPSFTTRAATAAVEHEKQLESFAESLCQDAMGQTLGQTTGETLGHTMGQTTGETLGHTMEQKVEQTVGHTVGTQKEVPTNSNWKDNQTDTSSSHQEAIKTNQRSFSASQQQQDPSSQSPRTTLQQLRSVLYPERVRLGLALGALLVSSCATLTLPKLLGMLVDQFRTTRSALNGTFLNSIVSSRSEAVELGLQFIMNQSFSAVAAVLLVGAAASGLRLFLLELASERVAYRLRLSLFESLLKKKIEFFDQIRTGELISRLSTDVTSTARILLELSFGIRNLLTSIIGTAIIIQIIPSQLAASLLGPIVAIFVFGLGQGKLVRRLAVQKQERLGVCASRAEEKLSSIRTVRLFNGEELERKLFLKELNGVARVAWWNSVAVGGRSSIYYASGGFLLLHLINKCGVLITSGLVSLGDVTSLILYVLMTGASYQGVISAYGDLQRALGSCHKIMDLIHDVKNDETNPRSQPELHNDQIMQTTTSAPTHNQLTSPRPLQPSPLFSASLPSGPIRFNDVWFSYPTRKDQFVLQGLNLEVPENSTVAVLGESGSGKSTLASLLMRFYEPSKGSIEIGGVSIKDISPTHIRSLFGVVNQDPTLFAMTIKENILYGVSSCKARRDRLEEDKQNNCKIEACRDGVDGLHNEEDLNRLLEATHSNFIHEFPDGLQTFVGEKGIALSGGQKQRICLARALAPRPPYLILDEISSALDTKSEKIVHEALAGVTKNTTTLIITHRLSTLAYCDYVAVLVEGKLAQFGTREEILQRILTKRTDEFATLQSS